MAAEHHNPIVRRPGRPRQHHRHVHHQRSDINGDGTGNAFSNTIPEASGSYAIDGGALNAVVSTSLSTTTSTARLSIPPCRPMDHSVAAQVSFASGKVTQ